MCYRCACIFVVVDSLLLKKVTVDSSVDLLSCIWKHFFLDKIHPYQCYVHIFATFLVILSDYGFLWFLKFWIGSLILHFEWKYIIFIHSDWNWEEVECMNIFVGLCVCVWLHIVLCVVINIKHDVLWLMLLIYECMCNTACKNYTLLAYQAM